MIDLEKNHITFLSTFLFSKSSHLQTKTTTTCQKFVLSNDILK